MTLRGIERPSGYLLHPANGDEEGSRTFKIFVWQTSTNQGLELHRAFDGAVHEISSFRALLEQADESSFGCLLLDYPAFREEVISGIAEFTKQRPGYPIVVWSPRLEVPIDVEAMKWGALDVLRHPQDDATLVETVRAALVTASERFRVGQEYQGVLRKFDALSKSELGVLALVMQGRTNKEIASKLDCSLRTVEARRQRTLRVMGAENAIELAVVLSRHGLMDRAIGVQPEQSSPPPPHWLR